MYVSYVSDLFMAILNYIFRKFQVDHLNLCRKNAYFRFISIFPQLAKDIRVAHVVLDIFQRALAQPAAARYLFERCSFVTWLGQLASVSCLCAELKLTVLTKESTFSAGSGTGTTCGTQSNE